MIKAERNLNKENKMSRYVRVASVPLTIPNIAEKPKEQHLSDFMLGIIRKHIEPVLPDNPDLIVLPEACDRPSGMHHEAVRAYYTERGDRTVRGLCEIARENNCYIAAGVIRDADDGKRYNSCVMIDRNGEVVGYYDKNYIVPGETELYGIVSGEDITVFECDFGRVGAAICFDLNFEELRVKYREAKCDLIVFPSHFDGGLLRNIFAHETGAYFVSCFAGRYSISAAFDPLGYPIATSSNYYHYTVVDLNLDYEICHLDENRQKFAAAKKKYGSEFKLRDDGYIGTVILTSECPERTVQEIIDEFGIETRENYYARSRAHRKKCL